MLAELKARGVPLYAITNWSAETFPPQRQRFAFLSWFDGMVISGMEGVIKPDPRIFRVLLERHVEGVELAVGMIDGEPLPAVEIRPRQEDRFDYEARYEIGRTEYLCPAEIDAATTAAVDDAARRVWEVLGLEGFARVDLIVEGGNPQVLEANAVPGLTDTSLLPMGAEAAGMSFEALVTRLLDLALARGNPAAALPGRL